MNRKKLRIWLVSLIAVIIFFILSGCEINKPEGGGNGGEIKKIDAPASVTAKIVNENGQVEIEWDAVDKADSYDVYRIEGNLSPVKIKRKNSTNKFTDSISDKKKSYTYSVIAFSGPYYSESSPESNPVTFYIQNISVTKFKYTDRIEIDWDILPDASSCILKRYRSKTDPNPVIISDLLTAPYQDIYKSGDPEDLKLKVDTPYYYRVTWISKNDNQEYGTDGEMFTGVYSTSRDVYELNDSWTNLKNVKSTTVFDPVENPVMYSFDDGSKDQDWYKFCDLPTSETDPDVTRTFTVTVTLPSGTPFSEGLYFQFYTEYPFYQTTGEFDPSIQFPVQEIYNGKTNEFVLDFSRYEYSDISLLPRTEGKAEVYFKIYSKNSDSNKIGSYKVEIY